MRMSEYQRVSSENWFEAQLSGYPQYMDTGIVARLTLMLMLTLILAKSARRML